MKRNTQRLTSIYNYSTYKPFRLISSIYIDNNNHQDKFRQKFNKSALAPTTAFNKRREKKSRTLSSYSDVKDDLLSHNPLKLNCYTPLCSINRRKNDKVYSLLGKKIKVFTGRTPTPETHDASTYIAIHNF